MSCAANQPGSVAHEVLDKDEGCVMQWNHQLGGMLQFYVEDPRLALDLGLRIRKDFKIAAERIPPTVLADALTATFQRFAGDLAEFGRMFYTLFEHSNEEQRCRLLAAVIPSLSPASQRALRHAGVIVLKYGEIEMVADAVMELSGEAVRFLAAEALREDPSAVEKVSEFYSRYPNIVKYLDLPLLAGILAQLAYGTKH